jgi:dolichol-phosphate mannosyltransferase
LISSIIAIEISIIANFNLNDIWTWRDVIRYARSGYFMRMFKYHVSAGLAAFLGNFILLAALTEIFGLYYIISNLIGIGAGVLVNFLLNNYWTYGIKE